MKIITLMFLMLSFNAFSQKCNTYVIKNDKTIIYYKPSKKELNDLKSKYVDDFYLIVDDENYYFYQSSEFLNNKKIVFVTTNNKYIYIYNEKIKMDISKKLPWGGFFIYKKAKYKEYIYSIDFIDWIEKNKF